MAEIKSVLVDTSALFAIINSNDKYHEVAKAAHLELVTSDSLFWATSYTLVESIALLNRRLGFSAVLAFEDWRKDIDLQIFWVDERLHDAAWVRFTETQGRGLSLVDWTITIASRELGAQVFTFDEDFIQQGVAVIPR